MHPPRSRRSLLVRGAGMLATTGAPAWLVPTVAQAQSVLRPTPRQAEGPFYPVALPSDQDFDLLRNGGAVYSKAQPVWVEGLVMDTRGMPVAGAVVEIWQCDHEGHYHHPQDGGKADPKFQGFGRVAVGKDGRYRFRTMRPAPYSGRTPHIHVKVKLDRKELLTTQLYVAGDPGNPRDGLWQRLDLQDRAALTREFSASADGLRVDFPIVVQV
ncbi:MAG: protocatechuate 3,4-dioxygenase [Rhodoferax sp.]|uniref:protocatechuate 3,4-dioxygenase n=1 Tax=Rhodoferax sp. TaxID=50421 RepID=UPI002ACDA1C5|nr:protocatechuate 3,4-dioxygenase [Rhodoferax sp.]MDZ7892039.1 protocatechuate 3,4-dioxygenase [Rhodoferax sp.]